MLTFSSRLKAERKRLKMTQTDLATQAGVTKQAQISYEKEKLPQFAAYLEAVAKAGVDVQYLLTGERSDMALTPEERQLLALFRVASLPAKAAAVAALAAGNMNSLGGNVTVQGDMNGGIVAHTYKM